MGGPQYQTIPQGDPPAYGDVPPYTDEPSGPSGSAAPASATAPAPAPEEYIPTESPPDYFDVTKFDGFIGDGPIQVQMAFIRRVYAILSTQLVLTAVMSCLAMFCGGYRTWMMANLWSVWVSLVATFVFLLATIFGGPVWPHQSIALAGFTITEAYVVSFITANYETSTVVLALFITLTLFFGLTLFAIQSTYDFTSWIPYLFCSLLLFVVGGFIAAFFPYSSTRELIYGGIGAVIFSAYILVDTHLIMYKFRFGDEIQAALTLYLDVINLFLNILRVLNAANGGGSRR